MHKRSLRTICAVLQDVPPNLTPGALIHDDTDCSYQYVVLGKCLSLNDPDAWDGEQGKYLPTYPVLHLYPDDPAEVYRGSVNWSGLHLAENQDAQHYRNKESK